MCSKWSNIQYNNYFSKFNLDSICVDQYSRILTLEKATFPNYCKLFCIILL